MKLETERLILKTAEPKDAPQLLPLLNSEFVLRYNCMRAKSLERFISQMEEEAGDENIFYLELKDSHEVIGAVYLTEDSIRYDVGSLMLEYWLGEPYARKGYMYEALKKLISHGFDSLGLELITVRVFSENIGSRGLVKKLGFTQEGELRRCVKTPTGKIFSDCLYSMTKDEWK